MATIWWEEPVAATAIKAWGALRRVDKAQELFAPVLVDGRMEGTIRTVIFANGRTVRERIVTVDEQRQRVVYCVLGGDFEHHSASMQILPGDHATCTFLWISDVLPDARAEAVQALVEQGARAFAENVRRLLSDI